LCAIDSKHEFQRLVSDLNMFTVKGSAEALEINSLYEKLHHQLTILGSDKFYELAVSKDAHSNGALEQMTVDATFSALQLSKSIRNVGDNFKWCVTDNWSTNLVLTINLRSLKNLLQLRDSGAAYFLIRELAQAMKAITPSKYLSLIVKNK